jgi:hypothetical protein
MDNGRLFDDLFPERLERQFRQPIEHDDEHEENAIDPIVEFEDAMEGLDLAIKKAQSKLSEVASDYTPVVRVHGILDVASKFYLEFDPSTASLVLCEFDNTTKQLVGKTPLLDTSEGLRIHCAGFLPLLLALFDNRTCDDAEGPELDYISQVMDYLDDAEAAEFVRTRIEQAMRGWF